MTSPTPISVPVSRISRLVLRECALVAKRASGDSLTDNERQELAEILDQVAREEEGEARRNTHSTPSIHD